MTQSTPILDTSLQRNLDKLSGAWICFQQMDKLRFELNYKLRSIFVEFRTLVGNLNLRGYIYSKNEISLGKDLVTYAKNIADLFWGYFD